MTQTLTYPLRLPRSRKRLKRKSFSALSLYVEKKYCNAWRETTRIGGPRAGAF